MKHLLIFAMLSMIITGCLSCNKETKGLKEEIRLLKEENSFLKAENIGLKKELEKLYKKLNEYGNNESEQGIKLKPEKKESVKPKETIKIDQGVKNKPQQ